MTGKPDHILTSLVHYGLVPRDGVWVGQLDIGAFNTGGVVIDAGGSGGVTPNRVGHDGGSCGREPALVVLHAGSP
jgi:hypothetical protein